MTPRARRRAVVLTLVAVVLVAVPLGAFRWLRSAAGNSFLKAKALAAIGDALAGRVEVDALSLDGEALHLEHLKLFTPEGELVAELDSVDARVKLGELARQRVAVDSLALDGVRVWLVRDARGLNLSRAIASKSAPAGPPPAWTIDLERVTLTHGQVEYREALPDAEPRREALQTVGATATVHLGLANDTIEGTLHLTGQATGALEGAVELTAQAASRSNQAQAQGHLTFGGSSLSAKWDGELKKVTIDQLLVQPEAARGLFAAWPVKVPLSLVGEASATRAQLHLKAGRATAAADATFTLAATPSITAFALQADDVDVHELFGALEPSSLSLSAKGSLPDVREASVTGALELDATARAGDSVVTLKAQAHAEAGTGRVDSVTVNAPGVTVVTQGRVSPRHLAMAGTLSAVDLSRLPQTVQRFTGLVLPPLAGSGSLDVDVLGPLAHPGITATGTLHRLQVERVSADEVTVDVQLPDLRSPLDTDATVHANRVTVEGRSFEQVDFTLVTHQRDVEVDLSTKGLGDTRIQLGGTVDRRGTGLQVASLTVTSSTSTWALEAPTHATWGEARFELEPLTLRDGAQRLTAAVERRGRALHGSLSATALDLSRLPRALAPESLGLSGLLSAEVALEGSPEKPQLDGTLELTEGALLGVRTLAGSARARLKDDQLGGTFTFTSEVGSGEGQFLLPVVEGKSSPVSAKLSLRQVDLEVVKRVAGALPLAGRVDLALDVSGTTAAPHVTATLTAASLLATVGNHVLPLTATELRAQTEGGPVTAQLHTEALGSALNVELTTPLSLTAMREHPPEVETVPFSATLRLDGLEAHQLESYELVDQELEGQLSLTAAVEGTLNAPLGTVTLVAQKLRAGPLAQLDGTVTLRALASETRLDATLAHLGKQVLVAESAVGGPLRELLQPSRLGPQSLKSTATLFPVDVATLLRPADGQPTPHGLASATLTASGTVEQPRVRLAGSVQGLKVEKAEVGSARFELSGDAATQQVSLAIGGNGASDLKVKGTLGLPLSPTARERPWSRAPIALTIDSRELELAFLSGLTPAVRLVGGALTMHAQVDGTLGDPQAVGEAHWSRGRLALYGFGDYRDIQLDATASNTLFAVTTLQVKSGAGSANLTLRAERLQPALWHFEGAGAADKFPIVTDDQLVATTTLTTTFAGEVTDSLVDVTALRLPRVEVELPDIKRKDLQDLQRPSDILVLRGGATRKRRVPGPARLPAASGRTARVFIDAQRNVWVRSSDLNIELGLSEGFRVETGAVTQVFGEATIVRGNLNVIGREFVVQKDSQVRFAGPAVQPAVNVTAVHTNEKEKVKVTVTVVGRGTDVTLKATSEPSMPESDIYTLLATGRLKLQRGSGTSITPEDAVSVVGQLAASQLKTALAKKLPIDVLNFEAADNFQRIKFDVGKYLSDRLYLGFSAQTGANVARGENPWAGRLELQMSRSVSLEVFAGTAPAAGGDVVWSRDF